MSARFHIGTQGWSYSDWTGPFYPERTPSSRFLEMYAEAFAAVEVDSSFYAVPPASHFIGWRERTPESFRFSFKLPGVVTHEHRLRGGQEVVETFCRRAEVLERRLGVILVQLPPDFTPTERPALESFLERLPDGFRFAVEFRHPDWLSADTLRLLESAGVAHALSDGPWIPRAGVMRAALEPTADVAYFRWLGERPHLDSYRRTQFDRSTEIGAWARVLQELSGRVRDIYGFFNNHYEGHSPASARRLLRVLGQPVTEPDDLNPQLSLF
ncbi:MAG: DUF72 domain-containing protein [Gemmatimonadetes bacterium]|uniref:DUF72 domain-containing protein n=1 Tax=Candidatus Kutchimonas denitrificans TaxID=3056748 RepID=A0AAE4Z6N5_9BACT|nr:DUF72 domain-containing protein [Gemmatimonadota bacterium]NIR73993.1 DUF72 domain-containing protein [Candidatus Kutchimonas denitrificans]NIS02982.1 DUF72 domain-containing protein [Gemmatimonadota bacterium]NIT68699.1 DUF72 domain-containing protein [Gemmatimonadota bacterium]NIU53280.1 DUF72 domain-containing protein [Gemmatimonadota bacterium]